MKDNIENKAVDMNKELKEALQRYETMVSNIEWHIKTNVPPEIEVKKLESQLDIYGEFISLLKSWQLEQKQVPTDEQIEKMVENTWLFLTDDSLPDFKNITKEAFYHELSALLTSTLQQSSVVDEVDLSKKQFLTKEKAQAVNKAVSQLFKKFDAKFHKKN
jgi:nitrogen fixation protein